jgi:hypothetical protein
MPAEIDVRSPFLVLNPPYVRMAQVDPTETLAARVRGVRYLLPTADVGTLSVQG